MSNAQAQAALLLLNQAAQRIRTEIPAGHRLHERLDHIGTVLADVSEQITRGVEINANMIQYLTYLNNAINEDIDAFYILSHINAFHNDTEDEQTVSLTNIEDDEYMHYIGGFSGYYS